MSVDTIAPGVLHRSYVARQGPWVVHVLDVDLRRCWTPVAVKGSAAAAGRTRTSELARLASTDAAVAGAVNADFFLFAPPGVPTGAHLAAGTVVTGPGPRPVFAVDSAGRPWIGTLQATGWVVVTSDSLAVTAWNRASPGGLAWFDAAYGRLVDTAAGSIRVVLSSPRRGAVLAIDSGSAPSRIPLSGGVLVLGRDAPRAAREWLLMSVRSRPAFTVRVAVLPLHPREAVGGFPVIVRDSMEVPGLDSAGAATFGPVRHPRTLVGVAAGGRRLLLVTIDGRQPGYSVGTTLRETARVARDLGATEAINLDGGGSTTMVVARSDSGGVRYRVVNRPSDPQGERAVGNALAVVCSAAPGRERKPGGSPPPAPTPVPWLG